jgi:hypothetical protein|tara:strand:- start:1489 stop:1842 length:354 start_codon:yes stop_codon:yes gene_type:complete
MADIRIIPTSGVIQFSGSNNEQVAFTSASIESFLISATASLNLNADSGVVVSGSFILSSSVSTSPFVIAMDQIGGDVEKLKVNSEGIVVLGAPDSAPTAVEGGIYYSQSIFYLGDGN